MFSLWKSWRRRRILKSVWTERERRLALEGAWQWRHAPEPDQEIALSWMRIFVHEKNFEGCGGFNVTDDAKWTIASQAALLLAAYPDWYFDNLVSILIYPDAYLASNTPLHDIGGGLAIHGDSPREGEAWYDGPVVLNWPEVEAARHGPNEGQSLVIHELAHKIDMWNSRSADGIPPLPSSVDGQRWHRRMEAEYHHAIRMVQQGHRIFLNQYGLTSMGEFFAVASESYFQLPDQLAHYHPQVFTLLKDFYRVDLRSWK